jgi:hypothetical protein
MMSVDQLTGRYFRLRNELAAAYASVPWNTGHIDRLTGELAAIEREIAALANGYRHAVTAPIAHTDPRHIALIAHQNRQEIQ